MPAPIIPNGKDTNQHNHEDDNSYPDRSFWQGVIIAVLISIPIWIVIGYAVAHANPRTTPTPPALLAARTACPDTASLATCRGQLRRALQAVAWQKHARASDVKRANGYGVRHAIRLASALYGVPLSEMVTVGTCESHLQPLSKNSSSTASGLFQFLDSTWSRAGVPGFSVFDPYANALAAARLVQRDGGWREWQCSPRGGLSW